MQSHLSTVLAKKIQKRTVLRKLGSSPAQTTDIDRACQCQCMRTLTNVSINIADTVNAVSLPVVYFGCDTAYERLTTNFQGNLSQIAPA